MSFRFLVEEYEEGMAELKDKAQSIWTAILDTWVSYLFWIAVIVGLTMACKPLLYWSAMTESLWQEILFKLLATTIMIFNAAVVITWYRESEIRRRLKLFLEKQKPGEPNKEW